MKRLLFGVLLVFLILNPLKTFAGEAVWNPSDTHAAYIDFISSETSAKTLFFYDQAENSRYRGTYHPLGTFMALTIYEIPPAATYMRITEWVDDSTIIIECSFDDQFRLSAFYEISLDGETRYLTYANNISDNWVSSGEWDYTAGWDDESWWEDLEDYSRRNENNIVWDGLEVSQAVEIFWTGVCNGDIPITEGNFPLTHAEEWSEWQTLDDVISSLDWCCDMILPIYDLDVTQEDEIYLVSVSMGAGGVNMIYDNGQVKVVSTWSP